MPEILVIGHSHIAALRRAWDRDLALRRLARVHFIALRLEAGSPAEAGGPSPADARVEKVLVPQIRAFGTAIERTVLCINGNEHNIVGLLSSRSAPAGITPEMVFRRAAKSYTDWLDLLLPHCRGRVGVLLPPPPVESGTWILEHPGEHGQIFEEGEIPPAGQRLALWQRQCELIRDLARQRGLEICEPPPEAFSPAGFLAEACLGNDPTHGNAEYGRLVLSSLLSAPAAPRLPHPYVQLPDSSFWKQSVSSLPPGDVDPVTAPPFRIRPTDQVATAGSCFAQHISKRLREGGFHFLIAEKVHGNQAEGEARGFYDFSARYGNLYTARQLLQLFDRAFGFFRPLERVWKRPGGGFCDPFRPRIEPDGFPSEEAVLRDSQRHLAAVRRMFQRLDVFVFTLGLTECWLSRLDGAAYPVAPGVAGGEYDPRKHEFANFGLTEVTEDLRTFLQKLKLVNPKARVILTVSPVPLVATAADRHVLVSTAYSKSVLRVAAEEIAASHENVCYFPSFEIITGPHAAGAYFGPDRRSVTERGVDHVMRIFMARMTERPDAGDGAAEEPPDAETVLAELEALAEAACDEEMLAR